jgi:hypothetical protein
MGDACGRMRLPPDDRSAMSIEIHPVAADRWPDLLRLFGDAGGHDGCWCIFWRLPN